MASKTDRTLSANTARTSPSLLRVAALEGYLAGVSFLFRQRVPNILPTLSPNFSDRNAPLVVLVPGYLEQPGCFAPLYNELVWSGIRVALYKPKYVLAGVREMSADFGRFVDELCSRPECETSPIVLAGHSMGGLIVRQAMLNRWQSHDQIQHLITIASPHNGTFMAHLGIGDCVIDMMPGSHFLNQLNASDAHLRHKMTSIIATPDALLLHARSAKLPGATHHRIDESGHMALLDDARLHNLIKGICMPATAGQLLGL